MKPDKTTLFEFHKKYTVKSLYLFNTLLYNRLLWTKMHFPSNAHEKPNSIISLNTADIVDK